MLLARRQLVQMRTQLINVVRGLLRRQRVAVPTRVLVSRRGSARLQAEELPPALRAVVGAYAGRLELWPIGSLYAEFRDLVLDEGLALEQTLRLITGNVARLPRLDRTGRIAEGTDADLVVLDDRLRIVAVCARGRLVVDQGQPVVRGWFEGKNYARGGPASCPSPGRGA